MLANQENNIFILISFRGRPFHRECSHFWLLDFNVIFYPNVGEGCILKVYVCWQRIILCSDKLLNRFSRHLFSYLFYTRSCKRYISIAHTIQHFFIRPRSDKRRLMVIYPGEKWKRRQLTLFGWSLYTPGIYISPL